MKSSSPLTQLVQSISWFLHRFHVIIFVLFVVGGLSIATLLLNLVITNNTLNVDPPTQDSFDTATIERLRDLQGANQDDSNFKLPDGRTSPFN